jgi:hypothetical protein
MFKLNLGCGSHIPSSWLNVDYAMGAINSTQLDPLAKET